MIDDKLLPFVLCVATCSVFVGVNSCCVTMDNTSFARLAGLCKAMDDHSKGIVGDLQAELDKEEWNRRDTYKKYMRMQYIAKLEMHKNRESMQYKRIKMAAKMVKAKTVDECDKLQANFFRSREGLERYLRKEKVSRM